MASETKRFTQKRTTLKTQLTILERLVAEGGVTDTNLKMRLKRVSELYHAYEEMQAEFESGEQSSDANEIQDRYYQLASTIEDNSRPASRATNSNTIPTENNIKRIKLPVAELPKFNGDLEKWLSFKNTFMTIIDAREDITNLQKFLYLRDSLQGEALRKVSIFDVSDENYKKAWELIGKAYDKKRVLISKHLDAIFELSVPSKFSHKDLTKLVDNVRQHVNILDNFHATPGQHALVRLIERALPSDVRMEWEKTLTLDESPSLEQLYTFLSETAFRLATLESDNTNTALDTSHKRRHSRGGTFPTKARREESGTRALVTNVYPNCIVCKKDKHSTFRCPEFVKWNVDRRWNFVKREKLCKNCLRSHPGLCRWPPCKCCKKYVSKLLHKCDAKKSAAKGENSNSVDQSSDTNKDK
ncbi:uncharacterized protein LOC118647175 [Monomorium pharaonis]|uniref:uncharacterized protein LOC118647175 n=1 Tax=Monomorium pharaonis TaxID=307658 RepID=UPI0017473511|nr:uncharacterized protein LOC118647175 [Monomorium pharaonis]